jgi:hypothetical protein
LDREKVLGTPNQHNERQWISQQASAQGAHPYSKNRKVAREGEAAADRGEKGALVQDQEEVGTPQVNFALLSMFFFLVNQVIKHL